MTRPEQEAFTSQLIDNIKASIMEKVVDFPAEWDGHELRVYIAHCFERGRVGSSLTDKRSKRYRNYENEVLVRNL